MFALRMFSCVRTHNAVVVVVFVVVVVVVVSVVGVGGCLELGACVGAWASVLLAACCSQVAQC